MRGRCGRCGFPGEVFPTGDRKERWCRKCLNIVKRGVGPCLVCGQQTRPEDMTLDGPICGVCLSVYSTRRLVA